MGKETMTPNCNLCTIGQFRGLVDPAAQRLKNKKREEKKNRKNNENNECALALS